MKTRTNLSIDVELLEKAKQAQLNMSAVLEDTIRKRLVEKDAPQETGACKFCGKIEEKATAAELDGLTWLCPDEVWICDRCLTIKKRRVHVSVG